MRTVKWDFELRRPGLLRRSRWVGRWWCRPAERRAIPSGLCCSMAVPSGRARSPAPARPLGIQHRGTKPGHAWTNGFLERLEGTFLTELGRSSWRRTYYIRLDSTTAISEPSSASTTTIALKGAPRHSCFPAGQAPGS